MKTLMYQVATVALVAFVSVGSMKTAPAETVTFEGLLSDPNTFYQGEVGVRGWTVGDVYLDNTFFDGGSFTFWSGWSYSNVVDAVTPGFRNQFASAPGGGSNGSGGVDAGDTYAISAGSNAFIDFATPTIVQSADVSNTTYARRSMETGDSFAKAFGGPSGNEADFFRATLAGFSDVALGGTQTGSVTVDLADFTFEDNAFDFILADWSTVDLSSLGVIRSLGVTYDSSDVGGFGINTPLYLAMDNLRITAVPEPGSFVALAVVAVAGMMVRRRRQTATQRRKK